MERLNEKQRKYVLHILHCVKNKQFDNGPKSSFPLRQFLGLSFTQIEQQDISEFLGKLSEKSAMFREQINNIISEERICNLCNGSVH